MTSEEYIEFQLHNKNFRYYSVERIDFEYRNKKEDWRPIAIGNHGLYKQIKFTVNNKQVLMYLHRVIYYAHNQYWNIYDGGRLNKIDHINHPPDIPLDNSISNLKVATQQQNNFNRNAKGYSYNKKAKKYQAYITINGKAIHLGYFIKEEDARAAYLAAKLIHHV